MTFTNTTPSPAKSLLRAATQTTSSPPSFAPPAASPIVPSSSSSSSPSLRSQLSTFNSSSTPSPSSPSAPAPLDPSAPCPTPLQDGLTNIQQQIRTAMREWSAADPRFKVLLENYNTILQGVTLERLTSTLPMLSNQAWVETNDQIIRLHAVMERTSSRHSREQRENETQARREVRERERKERQVLRDKELRAKELRMKERDEYRRQRDKEKGDLARQKQLALMRKQESKNPMSPARHEDQLCPSDPHAGGSMPAPSATQLQPASDGRFANIMCAKTMSKPV